MAAKIFRVIAVFAFVLYLGASIGASADMLPFHEVLSREIGPPSKTPIAGFNINHFDESRRLNLNLNCAELGKKKNCPDNMVFVCSEYFAIATCIDRDLYNDPNTGRPKGNMNLYECQNVCAQAGKRIPTNNEWLVGCTGSVPDACEVYYKNGGQYPSEYFAKIPGHVCNPNTPIPGSGPYNELCMTSTDLMNLLPPVPDSCVSEAGVRGCIATYHQWVSNHWLGEGVNQGFRFNGGSFVVQASAVDYVTPGHSNDFYHYANGCRCATDPQASK